MKLESQNSAVASVTEKIGLIMIGPENRKWKWKIVVKSRPLE